MMNSHDQARPGFFSRAGQIIGTVRTWTGNVLFLLFIVFVVVLLLSLQEDPIVVPDGAALVLNLDAAVVEEAPRPDPISLLLGGIDARPIQLRDLLHVIETGARDDRIGALVLDLERFPGTTPATLRSIGAAITGFRESGKPVVVVADDLTQSQYFLASYADQLYLNPMGTVLLTGMALEPMFFASTLDRLKVNVNVFRAGDYKSAVEPFLRDDMSPEARENLGMLIQDIWGGIRDQVAANRGMDPETLDALIDRQPERLRATRGDLARLALETGLVDELLTRDAGRDRLVNLVGADEDNLTFKQIGHRAYLQADAPRRPRTGQPKVAVVIAEGPILGGEQPVGSGVGERTLRLIRQAREDDDVRAIVLRVNSPGGSTTASEILRRELELVQVSGKPVVVSMGGTAASGGYWISATADRIFAEPETVTGSIGVYGLAPTFEDSAAALGIYSDGVRTHELAGSGNPLKPLNPGLRDILDQRVAEANDRFIELVARGRDMGTGAVSEIAAGRVWSGRQASERGLVDELGGLQEAITAAGELAGLERWESQYLEEPPTARELFLERLLASGPVTPLVRSLGDSSWVRLARLGTLKEEQRILLELLEARDRIHALCTGCGVSLR